MKENIHATMRKSSSQHGSHFGTMCEEKSQKAPLCKGGCRFCRLGDCPKHQLTIPQALSCQLPLHKGASNQGINNVGRDA